MHSENGVLIDFDEISRLVDSADVFTVGFGNFPERLIVDSRTDQRETPLIQVVEPARSARDRVAWLSRMRPSLGVPQSFSFFAWPHSPKFMAQTGVWENIRRRIGADMDADVSAQCEMALRQLENLDDAASMALLRGENCVTLWPQTHDDDTSEP